MGEKLNEIIAKVPIVPLALAAAIYFGYDYWAFTSNADSPLMIKQGEVQALKEQNAASETKLKELYKFLERLETKRAEVRAMASKLDEMKTILSEELDIPELIKLVVTEARKVGLTVTRIKPTDFRQSEFYGEQLFELEFKGVFVQLLVYLERLSSLERIIRVDNFEMKTEGSSSTPFVALSGKIEIKAYRYQGSKADEIAKAGGSPASAPLPGTPARGGATNL